MGHKVNPIGFRLGVIQNGQGWLSRWYAERDYKDIFAEDLLIRKLINKELFNASVSRIEIERAAANQVAVTIHTAKPGIVIGKSGEKVDRLRAMLEAKTRKRVRLNIIEIRQPELDAYLVGRSIAEQLEKRVSFRRAMKQAVQKTMRANAKGIKVICGGRLGGAEIARSEKEVEGKIPLHTLRANIDYGLSEAHTTFGVIGIKVWIYKGDILPTKRREPGEPPQEVVQQPSFQPRDGAGRNDRRRDGAGRNDRGDRGERRDGGDRGPRPQGDRPRSVSGDRGPRPQGDRPPRPQGDRPDRPPRPQGERGPRPQGDRPQGQAGQAGDRPQGDRPPRQPRPQGQVGDRPDRPPRPPRQPQQAQAPAEQAPVVTTQPEQSAPVAAPEPTTQTPQMPQTPQAPAPETGETQSE
ncbi:MAG: 30S ribosomal protein S3 [Ktedonobacteraceae bacterium]